jgi:hypothetical protein
VGVARGADVDDVDVLAGDDLPPVGGGFGPAHPFGGGGRSADVGAADDRHDDVAW